MFLESRQSNVCSQMLEGLFAILAECSQFCLRPSKKNREEIHHFAGREGGGLRGTKIVNKHFVNKHFVNKLAFPTLSLSLYPFLMLPPTYHSLRWPRAVA